MKINGLEFAGVDIETTGSDINAGAGICQIGVFLGDQSFVSDIRPHSGALITDEALRVNGFTHDRFHDAPDSFIVDATLYDWLSSFHIPPKTLIAIGWNVAGFDLPFIRKFLPKTATLFSYRTIDLNAVIFTMDPENGMDKLKRKIKNYAASCVNEDKNWHDALYDAKTAFFAWRKLHDLNRNEYASIS